MMKTAPHNEQHFEDIATKTVRLGGQVAHLARDIQAGGTSRNVGFVSSAVDSIGNRRPFDQRRLGPGRSHHGGLGSASHRPAQRVAS
jgi:hypothetical protein